MVTVPSERTRGKPVRVKRPGGDGAVQAGEVPPIILNIDPDWSYPQRMYAAYLEFRRYGQELGFDRLKALGLDMGTFMEYAESMS